MSDVPRHASPSGTAAGGRLWNRHFVLWWLGLGTSALGDAGVYVALPFLVLGAGGDAGTLATVLVLGTAPRFLGPLVGGLADRIPLRLPIGAAALARTVLFAGLGGIALAGDLPLWAILVAAPANGLLTLFVVAAGNVALPHLVPREDLARANGLVQGATMGLPLVGFGAAGAAVAAVGPAAVLCAAAPLFAALGIAVLGIRFPPVDAASAATPWWRDIRRGAGFVATRAPLAFLLVSSFVLNASLNALNVTVPVLMEALGRGAAGFGIFESLISAGILIGIGLVSLLGRRFRSRTLIAAAQLLFALGFAIMATGGVASVFAGGVVLGLGLGVGEVAILTLVQLAVPDGMRGKVMGVAFTANAAGLAFGAWAAGAAASSAPPEAVFGAAAALGLLMLGGWIGLQAHDPDALDRLVHANAPATGG